MNTENPPPYLGGYESTVHGEWDDQNRRMYATWMKKSEKSHP